MQILKEIQAVDDSLYKRAQERLDNLTKPKGSLGRLEEFAKRLVAITGVDMPFLDKRAIFTFAGDHGISKEGVSAFPKEVTRQMVFNFLRGGAGINVLARHAGADVIVIDVGVDYDFPDVEGLIKKKVVYGTRNMLHVPAMTKEEALRSIEVGIGLATEYKNKGYSIFGTGEMGIGNTTPSSAIAAVLTKRAVSEVTGRGTGIGDDTLKRKISIIERVLEERRPNPDDPLDLLSKVGGAEIGAIAGLCLGAAKERVPIVIDGFISTAGALIAYTLAPQTKDYMFSAHLSQEIGHRAMLEKIGLTPILDLDLRLGEGTGAALAMLIIEAGLKIYKEMATFGEAGVSNKE